MLLGAGRARRAGFALTTGLAAAASWGIGAAQAGGFLVREQSAEAVGVMTAGAAAGGAGLASMFWNPATITNYPGIQASASIAALAPDVNMRGSTASTLNPIKSAGGVGNIVPNSSDVAIDQPLPSGHASVQLTEKVWLGISATEPFAMNNQAPDRWFGSTIGITSKVSSYEMLPVLAYKVLPTLSVAAGAQVMRFHTYFRAADGIKGINTLLPDATYSTIPVPFSSESANGSSWGYGFTLGLNWKPRQGTEIGVGYRSAVRQNMKGNVAFDQQIVGIQNQPAGSYAAQSSISLPDIATIGLRERVSQTVTLLTGFEFDRWSRLQTIPFTSTNGATAYQSITPNYRNGWMASLGGEYLFTSDILLRSGVAYERSPVTNDNRLPNLPDADKIWASIGAGMKFTERLTADLSYAHAFGARSTINATVPVGAATSTNNVTLVSDAKITEDVLSFGLNYRFDNPAPRPAAPPPPPLALKY